MSLSAKARRAPVRAVTGAYILQSGLGKLKADEETAKGLHGFASGSYGFLGKLDPKVFAKGLGVGEIALGSLVLAPFVSPVVAGLGLVGFSGAILNMYWNTPGMHQPGDPRPTPQGIAVSKDVWMSGIGVALIADGLLEPAHDKKVEVTAARAGKKRGKQSRKDKKAAKKARAEAREHALEATKGASHELGRRAQKAANKAASKAAARASEQASKARSSDTPGNALKIAQNARESLAQAADEYGPVVADRAKQAAAVAREYADEYGPVVAGKAKQAADVAREYADEYGPVVAEKAKQARELAKDYAEEYGPVVAKNAKQARAAAQAAAERARERIAG